MKSKEKILAERKKRKDAYTKEYRKNYKQVIVYLDLRDVEMNKWLGGLEAAPVGTYIKQLITDDMKKGNKSLRSKMNKSFVVTKTKREIV